MVLGTRDSQWIVAGLKDLLFVFLFIVVIFLRLVILRSSGPGRDHKALSSENIHLNNDDQ